MDLERIEGRVLDVGQMPRLLDAVTRRARPFIAIAMNTGIARSDLLRLNRSDVDTRTRSLSFVNGWAGRRVTIRTSPVVSDILAGLLASSDSALVFPAYSHGASWLDARLDAAAKRAGVRGLEFDDLPGNWAWWAALEGVRPQVIADILGLSLRSASRWCSEWKVGSRPKPVDYVVLGISPDSKGVSAPSTTEKRPVGIVLPFRLRPPVALE